MGYPHHHIQSAMHGGSSIDPKFPPSTDDYHHHHHHHHNGYGHQHNGMAATMPPIQNNDYVNNMHHQPTNGMHTNNYNYSNSISGHFYQHSYNSQMHHTAAAPPPPPPPANMPQTTNNAYTSPNNNSYYGSYYGTNSNQMMDLPLQCPNAEPTNTVLGLHELGWLQFAFIKEITFHVYAILSNHFLNVHRFTFTNLHTL